MEPHVTLQPGVWKRNERKQDWNTLGRGEIRRDLAGRRDPSRYVGAVGSHVQLLDTRTHHFSLRKLAGDRPYEDSQVVAWHLRKTPESSRHTSTVLHRDQLVHAHPRFAGL